MLLGIRVAAPSYPMCAGAQTLNSLSSAGTPDPESRAPPHGVTHALSAPGPG